MFNKKVHTPELHLMYYFNRLIDPLRVKWNTTVMLLYNIIQILDILLLAMDLLI